MMRSRRSHVGLVINGAVVIAAGFGIALVEAYRLPKGSLWFIVGAAVVIIVVVRRLTRSR